MNPISLFMVWSHGVMDFGGMLRGWKGREAGDTIGMVITGSWSYVPAVGSTGRRGDRMWW